MDSAAHARVEVQVGKLLLRPLDGDLHWERLLWQLWRDVFFSLSRRVCDIACGWQYPAVHESGLELVATTIATRRRNNAVDESRGRPISLLFRGSLPNVKSSILSRAGVLALSHTGPGPVQLELIASADFSQNCSENQLALSYAAPFLFCR
eukprot:COSAG01_NODE_22053_length_873_cov_180.613169_1_plen_151_part_00